MFIEVFVRLSHLFHLKNKWLSKQKNHRCTIRGPTSIVSIANQKGYLYLSSQLFMTCCYPILQPQCIRKCRHLLSLYKFLPPTQATKRIPILQVPGEKSPSQWTHAQSSPPTQDSLVFQANISSKLHRELFNTNIYILCFSNEGCVRPQDTGETTR